MNRAVQVVLGMVVVAFLSGCATVRTSPDILVNIPPANGEKWTMNVQQNTAPYPAEITLNIDGAPLGTSQLVEGMANIKGTYSGHAVQAVCQAKPNHDLEVTGSCVIYVDGTQVTTIPF